MKLSLYSKHEPTLMKGARMTLFKPLFRSLSRTHITPTHITVFAFICAILFILVLPISIPFGSFFLLLHLILDMLDGSFARYLHVSGNKGAFYDMLSDIVALAFFVLGMIGLGFVHPLLGTSYLFLYTLSIVFAVTRNFLEVLPKYPLRSRAVVYSAFFLFVLVNINWIAIAFVIGVVTQLISVFVDAFVISKELV